MALLLNGSAKAKAQLHIVSRGAKNTLENMVHKNVAQEGSVAVQQGTRVAEGQSCQAGHLAWPGRPDRDLTGRQVGIHPLIIINYSFICDVYSYI